VVAGVEYIAETRPEYSGSVISASDRTFSIRSGSTVTFLTFEFMNRFDGFSIRWKRQHQGSDARSVNVPRTRFSEPGRLSEVGSESDKSGILGLEGELDMITFSSAQPHTHD